MTATVLLLSSAPLAIAIGLIVYHFAKLAFRQNGYREGGE